MASNINIDEEILAGIIQAGTIDRQEIIQSQERQQAAPLPDLSLSQERRLRAA